MTRRPIVTATVCITEDPETGVRNMGTYRAGLKATDRLGVRMAARPGGAGGYLHWQKYRKLKKPMPIAIVIGCAPVVMFTGPQKLPIDCDEMAVAGGLAGAPIRIVKAATVDLHVPADAEVVIEGVIDPELLEPEGPFGESHGHVALEGFNMSMQVTAITRKRTPVWASILSEVTPSESSVMKRVAYEPRYLAYLRNSLAIKGVRSVVMHEALTNLRKVMFLQMAPGTPRTEIWRALHGAASLQADIGKYVIAVSEDIDPHPDAVFWSLAYRANPIKDVQISPSLRGAWAEVRRWWSRKNRPCWLTRPSKTPIPRSRCRSANSWSTRARSGTNSACPSLSRSRPGTATRSATGTPCGTRMRSAP